MIHAFLLVAYKICYEVLFELRAVCEDARPVGAGRGREWHFWNGEQFNAGDVVGCAAVRGRGVPRVRGARRLRI